MARVKSQATIVVTILDDNHIHLASFGSPEAKDKTAEQYCDLLLKIAVSAFEMGGNERDDER